MRCAGLKGQGAGPRQRAEQVQPAGLPEPAPAEASCGGHVQRWKTQEVQAVEAVTVTIAQKLSLNIPELNRIQTPPAVW